jgi:predicted MFS family arabinose efflux permease
LGLFTGWLFVLAFLVAVPGARLSTGTWLVLFLPALFATGVTISPSLIMQQSLMDELAPSRRLVEAQGWLIAGITTGAALGAAIGGVLVDLGGLMAAYAGAAFWTGVAVVLATVMTMSRTGRSAAAAGSPAAVTDDPEAVPDPRL